MKKYISAKFASKPIYELEIVAVMAIAADINSSKDILKHRPNMPYEYQLSDKGLQIFAIICS